MFFSEWKYLKTNKFLIVVLIAIVLIPSIYAVGFLKSMWDPYGKIKDLPVAVVNEDQSVKYTGKKLAVGSKLKDNLADSDAMKFSFPSKREAQKGLSDGKYYMVMTIPKNFSEHATTLLDAHPKQMIIHYTTSSGHSFIAGKFSKSAAESITNSISTQVTKTYAETLFKQIKTLGNGMGTAANGNKKLVSGTEKLQSGNQTITSNLQTLASSSLTFSNGTDILTDGLAQYFDGVNQLDAGSLKLTDGLEQLSGKIPALSSGVLQLSEGSSNLSSGLGQYTSGVGQLNTGVSTLNSGAEKLASGSNSLAAGINKLSDGSASLNNGVSVYTSGTDKAYQGSQKVSDGLAQMNTALNSNDAKTKMTQLQTGLQSFQEGLNQLQTSLDNNQNSAQITQLTSTMSNLAKNVATISNYVAGTQGKIESIAKSQNLSDTQVSALESALLPTNEINDALKSSTSNLNDLQSNLTALMKSSDTNISQLQSVVNTLSNIYGTSSDSKTLYGAISGMIASFNQVGNSTAQLNNGASQLTNGLSQLSGQSQQLVNGSIQLQEGLEQLNANLPSLTIGIESLAAGSAKLNEGSQKLSQNSTKLNEGSQKLANGISSLNTNMLTLGSAVSQLSLGSSQLTTGLDKLSANNNKLLSGSHQLANGATKISDGSVKLAEGSSKLSDGLTKVRDGNATLADKLGQVNEKVNKIHADKLTYKQLATPASTKHIEKDKVPNNGTAMAPYMLSVALFVGSLAFNLMYDMFSPRKYPNNSLLWWVSKMTVLYPFAVVQATIMFGLMIGIVGLMPVNYIATYTTLVITSLTFISIVTMLNLWFGKVGAFLSMIFMVIQLGGSAGTYPIQLSNSFFEIIHPYLPMTYSVNALRETIMIGGSMWNEIRVLVAIFAIVTLLIILFYINRYGKLQPLMFKNSSIVSENSIK